MKFSVTWLREFVDLPDKIDKLADLLTLAGVEIEGIEERGAKIDKVIVAQITASSQHPNADRLTVCEVDDGSGTRRQIVCGAKNYKVGDKVPLALPGAVLPSRREAPEGFQIKVAKMRGVESQGMLCSAIELGLGEDAAGLLILSPKAKIGSPITDLFPSDTILDVEITPNRGDLLSHYGLAREIAALTGKKIKTKLPPVATAATTSAIKISAPLACPFFSVRKIDNVTVGPSPPWLRAKIERVGIRSINNIVDISNYVMFELGQPTHAFDADKIVGNVCVRGSEDDDEFTSLDGRKFTNTRFLFREADHFYNLGQLVGKLVDHSDPASEFLWSEFSSEARQRLSDPKTSAIEQQSVLREEFNKGITRGLFDRSYLDNAFPVEMCYPAKVSRLEPSDLLIADKRGAISIAGVMGGEETGVTASTKNVLLEAAYFLPASVRRTARNLGLPSDASYRFERGVDPGMVLRASQRATELICQIAGGTPAKQISVAGKLPPDPKDVSLSYAKCDQVLGISIKPKSVDQTLEHFGLAKKKSEKARSTWKVPSHRRDLQRDVDLIEEIVRAHGVEKIVGTDRSRFTATSEADKIYDRRQSIRQRLFGLGFNEVRTPVFLSDLPPENQFRNNMVRVKNPLDQWHVYLRPELLPGLLRVIELSLRHGEESFRIFELGKVFEPISGKEKYSLGILLNGKIQPARHWRSASDRSFDFFDLKGIIETLGIQDLSFHPIETNNEANSDFARALSLRAGDNEIGLCGQLIKQWQVHVNAKAPLFAALLDLDAIFAPKRLAFAEVTKFPAATRDIAMIVPEKISHSEILHAIQNPKEPLLESVALFDLFTGELGAARKSLAYTLTYRDRSRTLTSDEVTAAHAKIRERLQREVGAELRE